MIFNIQRFSTHDGPGIRTIVFLKGCSLHCPWCENPESQSFRQEIAWDRRKCIGCLECVRVGDEGEVTVENGAPVFAREKIRNAAKFKDVCPSGALSVIGEERSIEEIVQEVEKDVPFYEKSGGGVTLSGGEPYDQPGYLLRLLGAFPRIGVSAVVETTLNAAWRSIEQSLPLVQEFLVDIKHTDAAKLKEHTGGNLPLIMENLRRLERAGACVTARVPLIPGFNDSLPAVADIVDTAASFSNIRSIHFLPFHTLGVGKYGLLGREYRFLPDAELTGSIEEFMGLARSKGLEAITGG